MFVRPHTLNPVSRYIHGLTQNKTHAQTYMPLAVIKTQMIDTLMIRGTDNEHMHFWKIQ